MMPSVVVGALIAVAAPAADIADRYAGFVAAAYAISAVVLIGLTVASLLAARRWRREAERLEAAAKGRSEP